jgi:hypothetical protein
MPSIGMRAINCRPEGLLAMASGRVSASLRVAIERACSRSKTAAGNCGVTQDGTQHVERRAALVSHRQRPQRNRRPVHVHPTRQPGAKVGHPAGNLRLVHPCNTQIDQGASQGSHASLALAFMRRTRRQSRPGRRQSASCGSRQTDTRARSRLPALDLRAGVTQLRDKRQTQADQQHARIHERPSQ